MTAERWRQISAIYNAAIARGVADRTAYVSSACGGDDDLRRDVELLLAQGESFLASPVNLPPGSCIGAYELLEIIGTGGMGIVYRARDLKLQRDVALKVLPEAVALDPDRIARFRREATVLASLNHSNIGAIYGFEDSGDVHALVLELVDGPTLADRIAHGPIPLDEALPIARQIAEALEAAHEQGIIHRDLKPANIKVRPDGTVKVLDFGLAKLTESTAASNTTPPTLSMSPTITSPALISGVGVLLGTAAYMAPEQAKGKAADKRSDIWAFGCVLYEMLTGRCAFSADELSDTLAMVSMQEPGWPLVPVATPPSIRTLLRRCLEKDRKKRLPQIGAARLEIDEALSAPQLEMSTEPSRQYVAWAVAAAGILAALVISAFHFTEPPIKPPESIRFEVSPPPDLAFDGDNEFSLALSPDGKKIAFQVVSRTGDQPRLAVRTFDTGNAQVLPETVDATAQFWSPDSRTIGFFAEGKLKKIDATGGPSQVICDVPGGRAVGGGTWSQSGTIIFSPNAGPLLRVAAGGGTPQPVTKLDAAKKETSHRQPWFLNDGQHFLYFAAAPGELASIYIGSLSDLERTRLAQADSRAVYANDHIAYVRQGTLLAQQFDATRQLLAGDPVVLAQDVSSNFNTGTAPFTVSTTGVIAYRGGGTTAQTQLVVVDRAGKPLGTVGEKADQTALELSPDTAHLAVSVFDPSRRARDIWIHDLSRDVRTRFSFNPGEEWGPIWSPDGVRLLFSAGRPGSLNVYQQTANGAASEERLLEGSGNKYVSSMFPDGRFIMYFIGGAGSSTGNDIWILPTLGDRKPLPFVHGSFNETNGRFSPDGRWVAYASNESGRQEVYVVPFPGPGGKWQVSTAGGAYPRWRHDGKEIFFVSDGNTIMSAAVNGSGGAFEVGTVQRLFQARLRTAGYLGFSTGYVYDAFSDGQKFIIDQVAEALVAPSPITVITNWTSPLH